MGDQTEAAYTLSLYNEGSVEFMAEIVTLVTAVLGFLVWDLFRKNKQLRSQLESRLHAIENLGEPFSSTLAGAAPVPLKRAIHLNIHLDELFWRETLQLSSDELETIKASVPLHGDLSSKGVQDWEKWFYADRLERHRPRVLPACERFRRPRGLCTDPTPRRTLPAERLRWYAYRSSFGPGHNIALFDLKAADVAAHPHLVEVTDLSIRYSRR